MLTPSPQDSKRQKRQTSTQRPATPSSAALSSQTKPVPTSEALRARIAERAYERYAERGYRHGCALDDWLDAEREIMSQAPPV